MFNSARAEQEPDADEPSIEGPIPETDRYGDYTGHDYFVCTGCGIDAMHRALADECKGVGLRKAGFALALCVTGDKMCIDTHVAQQAGLGPDEIYNGVVVDRYEDQCTTILGHWPDLTRHKSQFMSQWIVFDANMETVTTHSAWFASLPEWVEVSPPGWD